MKQIFFDKLKMVFIKVFTDPQILERELCGLKNFRGLIEVPVIEQLDSRVAKISLLDGFLGYQVLEQDLNMLIAQFLISIEPVNPKSFSIFDEINLMKKIFKEDKDLLGILDEVKDAINNCLLYPVHGDLQKQNIIINSGKLGLIDFERFLFAPRELELVNSLFFNDGNCLDIQEIINLLPVKFINKKMFKVMLKFYALRQIYLGMDKEQSLKNLKLALDKTRNLNFEKVYHVADFSNNFCYI